MSLSAVDCISPAFEHTKQQLFRPFRFGQWARLALVGLFAGELSTWGGGGNFNFSPHGSAPHHNFVFTNPPNWTVLGPILMASLIAVPVIWLVLTYVNSRMRFVLFDSVLEKNCEVGRMWRAREEPGLQLFIWQIAFSLAMLTGLSVILGGPALIAFLLGWFSPPRQHLAPLILTGLCVLFLFLAWLILSIVVHVFTKDFVVPQMALENLSAFEGWRRLWQMVRAEKGPYAGYAGMKVIMAIGAAFAIGVVAFVAIVLLLIPFGGLGAIAVLWGMATGLTWNVFTITAAIVAGCIFLVMALYAVSWVSAPVIVFFPAYSIHFFASRYPLLARVLYPPAPPAAVAPEPGSA